MTEEYIRHIGWRRTKQSGWCKISSTFMMDIFGVFQHLWWKFLTISKISDSIPFKRMEIPNVSKISDYIPFLKDGNFQLFEVFRLHSLFIGWKSPTFRRFPIILPFLGWKSPTFRSFPIIFPFKGWKSTKFTVEKIKDYER